MFKIFIKSSIKTLMKIYGKCGTEGIALKTCNPNLFAENILRIFLKPLFHFSLCETLFSYEKHVIHAPRAKIAVDLYSAQLSCLFPLFLYLI